MKKTQEQIQQEVINYLTKTSQHTFIKPGGTYFKIFKSNQEFHIFENGLLKSFDYQQFIKWYGENAKNVIKHRLFLDKKMTAVKNIDKIEEIKEKTMD